MKIRFADRLPEGNFALVLPASGLDAESVRNMGGELRDALTRQRFEGEAANAAEHFQGGRRILVLGVDKNGNSPASAEKLGGNAVARLLTSGETAAIIDPNNPMSKVGLYNLDPTRKGFGYGVNGAMTKYVSVPARCLHRIPDELPFEQACLTEPCCVAYNAIVENSHLKPGDRVIVLGPGTIGILCAAVARLCGADVAIVGLEADRHRLAIAEQYGCRGIVGDATEWAKERDGLGVDCNQDGTDRMIDGSIRGAFTAATAALALDFGRLPDGMFHSLRLALLGSAGMMPQVRDGKETDGARYSSIGLTLTLGFGAH